MDLSLETLKDPAALVNLAIPVGLKLLGAIAIFIIGRMIARVIVKLARAAMNRSRLDDTLTDFLGNVLLGILMAVVIVSALGQLGINTTSAAALLGGAALAIGLSLKDQLSSLAAGVMIIMFRPFNKGDLIEVAGLMGVVEQIRIVSIQMRTPNNQQVMIPNAEVWGGVIINYSAKPTRRLDLTVGISYGADLRKAKQILEDIIKAEPRVLAEPAPLVLVKDLGASSVDFAFRPWMKVDDFWLTRCDLVEKIKLSFDEHGIEIPFPQMDIHVRDLPAAEEKSK